MKLDILVQMVRNGKKPLVKITSPLWDDSFGRGGMLARVVSAAVKTGIDAHTLTFDYNEHREHNLALDGANWIIRCGDSKKMGTAIDADIFEDPNDLREDVTFHSCDDVPVEFMGDLLKEYVDAIESDGANSSNRTYVKWLESELQKARWSISRE